MFTFKSIVINICGNMSNAIKSIFKHFKNITFRTSSFYHWTSASAKFCLLKCFVPIVHGVKLKYFRNDFGTHEKISYWDQYAFITCLKVTFTKHFKNEIFIKSFFHHWTNASTKLYANFFEMSTRRITRFIKCIL